MKTLIRYATLGLAALALPGVAQQPSTAERVAALKATMAADQVGAAIPPVRVLTAVDPMAAGILAVAEGEE